MPTEFLAELLDLLQALWATPNRWLRRLIIVAVATPFFSMLMGMFWGPLAMVTTLVPVLIVVGWATLAVDPLVIGILNRYDFGKKFTGWVIFVAGMELAWGFFCGIFPLRNDLRVSFTALFALLAAAALAGGAAYLKLGFSWPKKLAKLLVFAAIVCGVILLLVGDKPKEGKSILERSADNALETKSELAEIASSFSGNPTGAEVPTSLTPNVDVCAGAQDITVGFTADGVEVALDSACWTGWIQTPPSAEWDIRNGHKKMEIMFLNGQTWDLSGPPKWVGTVPSSTWRLRGEGPATIYVARAQTTK